MPRVEKQAGSVRQEQPLSREEQVKQILERTGAVITESHIVYTSGRHGTDYVNKDAVYPHTKETSTLCGMLAKDFKDQDIEVVAAPAVGGVILSQWTASHLTELTGREVLGVYAEKQEDGSFAFGRGYADLISGKRVLLVEDVLTTGSSAKKTIDAVKNLGGKVVGLGVICNRGGVKPEDVSGVEINALVNVQMVSYLEEECPQCVAGVPINTKVGKGKEYLARKQQPQSS